MDNTTQNLETSDDPNRGKRKKKRVKIRLKMDDSRKKKQRRQNILMVLVIVFILGLLLVAYVLYKMDQNSAPQQFEVTPPSGG